MQNASTQYKASMSGKCRNRGYIKAIIGVINQEAQENVSLDSSTEITEYSNAAAPFTGETVTKPYATSEQDLSAVDGSMYFISNTGNYYNNGIITEALSGSVCISFNGTTGLDIKGLTIDFGECYPTDFTIRNDNETYSYSGNTKRYWTTEDVFEGTSYLIITPIAMSGGQDRLRIYSFQCGIANTFTNVETLSFTQKDYVSSITESIPSRDITLEVDNQSQYYSPDNPDSTLAFFEVGQEVLVSFGYDIDGTGNIEWLPTTKAHLKTWSADDTKAKFTATDRFDNLSDTYNKGLYRANGISLYDLALDVIADMGITDTDEYWIDHYIKDIYVTNPMPVVKHSEALQIIANAGRCSLYEDRNGRIHIASSFIPDMSISCNGETDYSNISGLLNSDAKDAYAEASCNYSAVDGTMYFMAANTNYLNTGYISGEISDENGAFNTNPKITIELEAAYTAYGLTINFRSIAPQEFTVTTYYEGVKQATVTFTDPDTAWTTYRQFEQFDKLAIEITKGAPNSRVFIDNIIIGDVTDYTITRDDMSDAPTATRQNKVKSIAVSRTIYSLSAETEAKDLVTETLTLTEDTEYTVNLPNASYNLTAHIVLEQDEEGNDIPVQYTVSVIDSSSYYAKLKFEGVTQETTFSYAVSGYEYATSNIDYAVQHNTNGEAVTWSNPLISDIQHAKDMEEWLSSYYLGDVDYSISWRGDPRTDANDLFYMELKDRPQTMIRAYQSELKFSGAWSGTLKARKAVLQSGS